MDRGITFGTLFLALQLVLLPAMSRGKELILGEAGNIAELPCKATKKENMDFTWKQPDQLVLLRGFRKGSPAKVIGTTKKKDRVDTLTNQWDGGSFPLIIKKLEMADSGTYFCEVEARKHEVQLLVFKVTAYPSDPVFSGTNVTLTLHGPSNLPDFKVEWSHLGDKRILSQDKILNLYQVGPKEGGDWLCTISVKSKTLTLSIKVQVFGFTSSSQTLYNTGSKNVEFSFPLSLNEQELKKLQPTGELRWQVEGLSSPPELVKLSWKNDFFILENNPQNFKLLKKFPLTIILLSDLNQHAGSGVFSLKFSSGILEQKVNLVIMKAQCQKSSPQLSCEVLGYIIPGLTLNWMLENSTEKNLEVSKDNRKLEVKEPKAGTWECQLLFQNEKLLKSNSFKLTAKQEWHLPFHLGIGLGAGASLLLLSGLGIFCCARRRHRLRRAERMSQIRRLLSEKKTCQCPHRF
ncbi:T-cell surface glycoprotein CD4 [Macrotis lagotis]|uniref:T-cell surface glycoprotein CD4 n=1 Tax=Macrotis lagotis TaxID=92651 RepID=UPI003D689296